jgi:para-aminobenzoate synthetase/4-amino-4-deoxychorismate lyase
MTSTVQATLRPEVDLIAVFEALFPCGSVTGAPKVQTMRHIAAQETGPRGGYCGAIGLIRPGGASATFSVAIRTAVRDAVNGEVVYGVGGGITADSVAASEWQETVDKSAILHRAALPLEPPFDLLETLLLRNGEYALLQRHMTRLKESACFFERPCDRAVVLCRLAAFAESHAIGDWRVRLLVDAEGTVTVEGAPLTALPSGPLTVRFADAPVSRDDITLFHKTTRRAVYDRARTGMPDGIFDTLLWNREGEVTEFTNGNLIIEDSKGERWTPCRDSGLLAGTLRAELLEAGGIRERRITVAEIREVGVRLFFANGVRGVVPVRLVSSC